MLFRSPDARLPGCPRGGEDSPERLREHLESHLGSRIRHGFDLAEIVDEFAILERCVASVSEALPPDERPSRQDRDRIFSALQRTIVTVTDLFQEHMRLDEQHDKRYLRLLQSLADEALRAPEAPLGTRLKEVLEPRNQIPLAPSVLSRWGHRLGESSCEPEGRQRAARLRFALVSSPLATGRLGSRPRVVAHLVQILSKKMTGNGLAVGVSPVARASCSSMPFRSMPPSSRG